MDEPEGRAADAHAVGLVLYLGQPTPELARGRDQLADLLELLGPAVALVAGVQGEPEHSDRVGLAGPEERSGHREVLMDAGEGDRLREGLPAPRLGRLEELETVGDPVRVAGEHVPQVV